MRFENILATYDRGRLTATWSARRGGSMGSFSVSCWPLQIRA